MTPSTVRELRVTYEPGRLRAPRPVVNTPAAAVALIGERLESEPVEVVLLLLLDTKHRLIAVHELSRGILDSAIVHPRDTYKIALLANAAAVVVAHNHPSGDPSPSPDDCALASRLTDAGKLLGVDLLDFLIIGAACHCSFKESGRI